MPIIRVLNLGRMAYMKALDVQNQCVQRLQSSILKKSSSNQIINNPNVLILVEHEPVYTIGIRSQNYPDSERQRLKSLGADFIETNRGGLITFHGLGQLVSYPILYLPDFLELNNGGIKCYVRKLEATIINMSREILSEVMKDPKEIDIMDGYPGVWVNNSKKIGAIGIHAKDGITSHGIAINCNVDLKWFNKIVPCGIEGKGVTSYSHELKEEFTVNQAVPAFLESFRREFNCDFINGFEDENVDQTAAILTKRVKWISD